MGELSTRIVSAAVILPLAAAAIWIGGAVFTFLVALVGALMLMEGARLARAAPTAAHRAAARGAAARGIAGVFGALLIVGACAAVYSLRAEAGGLQIVVWLVVLITATDVGAYTAGRTFGGPKLAPRISPNKTWAGLIGGMAAAAGATALLGLVGAAPALAIAAAAILAACAQAGDLLESWAKRRASVKDLGRLIPGHGGLLDRLDGYLTAAPALWLYQAAGAPTPRFDLPPAPF